MRIAITGGIAEGKSTVLKILEGMGYETLSADAIVRDFYTEEHIQLEVARITGLPLPVAGDALRRLIQANDEVRRSINQMFHPLVSEAFQQSSSLFYEVPLLVEVCLQGQFDAVWVATCNEEIKKLRLKERFGGDVPETLENAQLGAPARLAFADAEIKTDGSMVELARDIALLVETYC